MPIVEKWKKIKVETVFQAMRYYIRCVDFIRPGNQPWNEVYLREEPDAVGIFAVTTDNKIVMVQHYRPGPDEIITELPAGDVEDGSPMRSAIAELLEETGFRGKEANLIGTSYRDAYSSGKFYSVVITGCVHEGIPKEHQKDPSLRQVVLMSIDEFEKHLNSEKMTNAEAGVRGLNYLRKKIEKDTICHR